MILIDANLLVYAQVTSLAQHEAAREWFEIPTKRHHGSGLALAIAAALRPPRFQSASF
ncbi:MAG: hypothetical protein NNA22_12175 [Nitrospira sp.]|nr:hypothetical protein [Nitrospira sp.]